MLQWLGEGVRVPWNERGPPAPFHHGVASFAPAERSWLSRERDRCLLTGAWRRATDLRFVSRAFVTYHKGKPRLVIDLRWVNEHTQKRSCKFESLSSLRRLARRHDWMFSLDMTDAYHHVGFCESDVPYFTFALETDEGVEYFSTSALNFGWTLSPWVFTTVMRSVVRYLRNPSIADPPQYGTRQHHARRRRSPPSQPLPPGTLRLDDLDGEGDCLPDSARPSDLCGDSDGRSDTLSDALSAVGPTQFGSEAPALARGAHASGRWATMSALGRHLASRAGVGDLAAFERDPDEEQREQAQWERHGQWLQQPETRQRMRHATARPRWQRRRERPAERARRRLHELCDAAQGAPGTSAELRPHRRAAACALAAARAAWSCRGRSGPAALGRAHVGAEAAALCVLQRLQPHATARQQARRTAPSAVRTLPWLDDFAFFQQGSLAEACAARDHVGGTFDRLGLARAEGKGQWEPSHFLEDHLGYAIDSERGLFLLTPRREAKLASQAHWLLHEAAQRRRLVRSRQLAGFCGLGQASYLALPLGRFMLRSMYDDLAQRGRPQERHGLAFHLEPPDGELTPELLPGMPCPVLPSRRGAAWRGYTRLSSQSLTDLRWWASLRGSRYVGRAIWRRPDSAVLYTDASDLGWGGTVDHAQLRHAPALWRPPPPTATVPTTTQPPATALTAALRDAAELQGAPAADAALRAAEAARSVAAAAAARGSTARRTPAAGFWSPDELPMHITQKELRAVRLSVEHFLPELLGRRVLLREDNMAVVWILTNMVTRSPALMAELRRLHLLLDACDIELRPLYIRSAANVVADYASVAARLFGRLCTLPGTLRVAAAAVGCMYGGWLCLAGHGYAATLLDGVLHRGRRGRRCVCTGVARRARLGPPAAELASAARSVLGGDERRSARMCALLARCGMVLDAAGPQLRARGFASGLAAARRRRRTATAGILAGGGISRRGRQTRALTWHVCDMG